MDISEVLRNPLVQVCIAIAIAGPIQIVGTRIIDRVVHRIVKADRHGSKVDLRKRADTVSNICTAAFVVLVWMTTLLSVLSIIFHINIAAIVTGAGAFSLILGLGAQTTIKDYLAGMYVLLENQYRVGDIITMSGGTTGVGVSGVVEEVGLRITKLRGQDGTLNIVRNGEPTVITNQTFKYASVVIDFTLDYNTDINKLEKVINQAGKDMLKDEHWNALVTEPISFLRIEDMNQIGIVIRTIGKVRPAAQWDVAGEFRRRIKNSFAKNGIQFAMLEVPALNPALQGAAQKK